MKVFQILQCHHFFNTLSGRYQIKCSFLHCCNNKYLQTLFFQVLKWQAKMMHARFAEVNHSSFWYLKTLYIQLKENIYFPVVKGVHTRWRRHQIINVSMCEHDNLMKFSAILRHPFGLEITVLEGLSLGRSPKDIATEHFYSFISQYMSSCTACLDFFLKSTGEKKRQ